ncbi:MAG: hypothetical protein FWD01_00690 [Defluviitaleaceae bacterium]|nr:hypothetical protein [Defluviitaleaceae bacterium]
MFEKISFAQIEEDIKNKPHFRRFFECVYQISENNKYDIENFLCRLSETLTDDRIRDFVGGNPPESEAQISLRNILIYGWALFAVNTLRKLHNEKKIKIKNVKDNNGKFTALIALYQEQEFEILGESFQSNFIEDKKNQEGEKIHIKFCPEAIIFYARKFISEKYPDIAEFEENLKNPKKDIKALLEIGSKLLSRKSIDKIAKRQEGKKEKFETLCYLHALRLIYYENISESTESANPAFVRRNNGDLFYRTDESATWRNIMDIDSEFKPVKMKLTFKGSKWTDTRNQVLYATNLTKNHQPTAFEYDTESGLPLIDGLTINNRKESFSVTKEAENIEDYSWMDKIFIHEYNSKTKSITLIYPFIHSICRFSRHPNLNKDGKIGIIGLPECSLPVEDVIANLIPFVSLDKAEEFQNNNSDFFDEFLDKNNEENIMGHLALSIYNALEIAYSSKWVSYSFNTSDTAKIAKIMYDYIESHCKKSGISKFIFADTAPLKKLTAKYGESDLPLIKGFIDTFDNKINIIKSSQLPDISSDSKWKLVMNDAIIRKLLSSNIQNLLEEMKPPTSNAEEDAAISDFVENAFEALKRIGIERMPLPANGKFDNDWLLKGYIKKNTENRKATNAAERDKIYEEITPGIIIDGKIKQAPVFNVYV